VPPPGSPTRWTVSYALPSLIKDYWSVPILID
jgi:hypothetical protein